MNRSNRGNHLKSGSSDSNTINLRKLANLDSRYHDCEANQFVATIVRNVSAPVGFRGAAIAICLLEKGIIPRIPRAGASTLSVVCERADDVDAN